MKKKVLLKFQTYHLNEKKSPPKMLKNIGVVTKSTWYSCGPVAVFPQDKATVFVVIAGGQGRHSWSVSPSGSSQHTCRNM